MAGSTTLKDLTTGLAEVDVEHELQLELVEALAAAAREGQPRAVLSDLLQRLEDASNVHFMSEEVLMRLHAWERYEDHVEAHRRLLVELGRLRVFFGQGSEGNLGAAVEQVRAWFADHVRGMDRAFADYVARGGLAAASR